MLRNFRAILALVLMILISATAQAELMRGSTGDEVKNLQNMLFDMGYLSEQADGQFGAVTEEAVKEYQQSTGQEITGVVTDALMENIYQDWTDYWDWIDEQLNLDAAGEGAAYCCSYEDANGHLITETCRKHAMLWETTLGILFSGDADSAEHSYYEWQTEIIRLYNEWLVLAGESAAPQIEANKAQCIQLMRAQHSAMFDSYDAVGAEAEPTAVYYDTELLMRSHASWLCQMLGTIGGN